jgi:glycosidase
VGNSGDGKPSTLMNGLMANYNSYAPQVSRNLMNLLGSHDTARILTECGGDRARAKLAAVLLLTWVGTPSIYYGDELGMTGDRDPDNRRGMVWGLATPGNEMLALYRNLIRARNRSDVLRSGDPVPLLADDGAGIAAYARVFGRESAVIVLNRSNAARALKLSISKVPHQGGFSDVISGASVATNPQGAISLTVPAGGYAVLVPTDGRSRHPSKPKSTGSGSHKSMAHGSHGQRGSHE